MDSPKLLLVAITPARLHGDSRENIIHGDSRDSNISPTILLVSPLMIVSSTYLLYPSQCCADGDSTFGHRSTTAHIDGNCGTTWGGLWTLHGYIPYSLSSLWSV